MDGADVIMVGLTTVSVVTAVAALGIARQATAAAAGGVLEAKEANTTAKNANVLATSANSLSERSNAIAEQAAQDARDAPTSVAWDELLVAVAAIQNVDPTDPKFVAASFLTALRTRAMLLIDRVHWEHFDRWVATEQLAGVMLLREASEEGEREFLRLGHRVPPDQAMEILRQFHLWVMAYQTNLRMCRKTGAGEIPFEELTALARKSQLETAARNGWPVPPEKMEGIEPFLGAATPDGAATTHDY